MVDNRLCRGETAPMGRPRSERAGDRAVVPNLRELQAAQRRYEEASEALAAARSERGAVVMRARATGLTWREISEQLGTSVQRAEAIFTEAIAEEIERHRQAGRTWRWIEVELGLERGRAEQLTRRRPPTIRRLPPKGKPPVAG